jgi:predicted outer membrane protein
MFRFRSSNASSRLQKVSKPVALEPLEARVCLSISVGGAHDRAVHHALVRRAADIQFLREHLSSNALEVALFKLGAANSSDAHVRHFSRQAIKVHTDDELASVKLAKKQKIAIRLGMTDTEDQTVYKQVLAAVNTPNFDQVYLTTLKSVQEEFAAQNDDHVAITRNANFRYLAQQDLTLHNGQLAAIKVFLGL